MQQIRVAETRSAPILDPERLADVLEEAHTRRAWWLDLHTSSDILAGTTITDIDNAVSRVEMRR